MRKVPDLLGLTVDEARARCQPLDILITEPEAEYGPVNGFDEPILRQRPPAGTPAPRGGYVMVWTTGPGGEGGVREPRRPFPPVLENRATADPADEAPSP